MKDDLDKGEIPPNLAQVRADELLEKQLAEQATYEDEHTSRRTVTIPLKEYDELKSEQHFIKDPSLISIIDKVEELIEH